MLENQLHDLIAPVIHRMGFALWSCEIRSLGQNQALLRINIDSLGDGASGVTLDHCAMISREIGALLDVADLIKQRYQLEVSSPGVERTLTTLSHFERYANHLVKIRLRAPKTGRRQFTARIECVTDGQILVAVEQETMVLTLSDIQKANVVGDH